MPDRVALYDGLVLRLSPYFQCEPSGELIRPDKPRYWIVLEADGCFITFPITTKNTNPAFDLPIGKTQHDLKCQRADCFIQTETSLPSDDFHRQSYVKLNRVWTVAEWEDYECTRIWTCATEQGADKLRSAFYSLLHERWNVPDNVMKIPPHFRPKRFVLCKHIPDLASITFAFLPEVPCLVIGTFGQDVIVVPIFPCEEHEMALRGRINGSLCWWEPGAFYSFQCNAFVMGSGREMPVFTITQACINDDEMNAVFRFFERVVLAAQYGEERHYINPQMSVSTTSSGDNIDERNLHFIIQDKAVSHNFVSVCRSRALSRSNQPTSRGMRKRVMPWTAGNPDSESVRVSNWLLRLHDYYAFLDCDSSPLPSFDSDDDEDSDYGLQDRRICYESRPGRFDRFDALIGLGLLLVVYVLYKVVTYVVGYLVS
eukprot:GILK01011070.1.p1 GENE.GILK01011070.1~~GILK01011070.1.p1  ORF type:complete len:428 (-),score=19.66 GILK01011070.1:100-1383(-)